MQQAALALGLCLVAALLLAVFFHRKKHLGEGLSATSAFVTVVAVLLTAYWFVLLRPDAPKLKIDVRATPIGLPDNKLLLVADIEIQNVGGSPIMFEKATAGSAKTQADDLKPFQFMVQRVTPLPEPVAKELDQIDAGVATSKFGVPPLVEADNWELLAWIDTDPQASINVGEVENYYYRTRLDCQPDLRMYVGVRIMQKQVGMMALSSWLRGDENRLAWIKQSLVDASEICRGKKR